MHRLGYVKGALSGHLDADDGGMFLLLGGEQQAIGELMIASDGLDRPRCLGYVAFRRSLRDDPEFAEWFSPLLGEIERLIDNPRQAATRLTTVHNALIDLITFLDPRRVWVLGPHEKFERASLPEPGPEHQTVCETSPSA